MAEQLRNRLVQRLARQLAGRTLILAILGLTTLGLASGDAIAEKPSSLGLLTAQQLEAQLLESDPEPALRAQITLWLAYKLRHIKEDGVHWREQGAAALVGIETQQSELVTLNSLLACTLDQHQGLTPKPACLDLHDSLTQMVKPDLRAISWHLLSNLHQRSGLIPKALEFNQLALIEAKQAGLSPELAEIHNSRGVAYLELNLPLKAFEQFEFAHQYLGESQNLVTRRVLGINLGVSQLRAELFDDAKQTFLAAMPWISESGNTYWMTSAITFLAQAEIGLGNPEAAVTVLQAHLDANQNAIDNNTLLAAEIALAEALLAQAQVEPALAKLTTALAQAKANNNSSKIDQLQLVLARAYNLADRPTDALLILAELNTAQTTAPSPESSYQALRVSAASHAALGNYAKAFAEQAQAQKAERTNQSSNFKTQLSLLQAKLDRDKNAHELMLSQQRERELFIQTRLSQTILVGSLLLGSLLVLIVYLLLSRLFQQRLAERERYASARLEAQVIERTQALESTMAARLNVEEDRRLLQQSLFEGEKLRALGQLTGGIAHDFNNLMTVVTLSAELLKDDLTEDQARAEHSVNDILRAAESAADITSGLLAYARKQPLKPELVELQTFTRELLPLFQRSLDENISLQLNAPESCQVAVDRSQLTTCLLNLLLNAKEALTEGGAIVIAVEPAPGDSEEFVRISVTDNGRGMHANQLKQATEPFFTTKGANQGSGLGLSMVFGFVKQSGGDLHITSTENLGTEVTISLPTTSAASQPNVSRLISEPALMPQKAKVLVVEDQREVRDVLQRLLESLGLVVSIATSGDEGKRVLAEQGEPDLLITDIVMPGETSGYDLAAFAQERFPQLAILIISGYSESHDSEWPFLHKPFSLNELREKVTQLLARKAKSPQTLESGSISSRANG